MGINVVVNHEMPDFRGFLVESKVPRLYPSRTEISNAARGWFSVAWGKVKLVFVLVWLGKMWSSVPVTEGIRGGGEAIAVIQSSKLHGFAWAEMFAHQEH